MESIEGIFIKSSFSGYTFRTNSYGDIYIQRNGKPKMYQPGQKVLLQQVSPGKFEIMEYAPPVPTPVHTPAPLPPAPARGFGVRPGPQYEPAPAFVPAPVPRYERPPEPARGAEERGLVPRRVTVFQLCPMTYDMALRNNGIRLLDNLLKYPESSERRRYVQRGNDEGRRFIREQGLVHSILGTSNHYCREIGMGPQLDYMDRIFREERNIASEHLKEYVRSAASISGDLDKGASAAPEHVQVAIGAIDSIFSGIPALTAPITVYRKWGKTFPELERVRKSTVDTNFSTSRYLSTALSLAIPNEQSFHGDDETAQYARIDIMPGVHVLPLLDWESWSQYHASCLSQTEILLPRDARLHKIVGSTLPEFRWGREEQPPMAVGVVSPFNPSGTPYRFPRIQHHFIVSPSGLGQFSIQLPDGTMKFDRTGGGKQNMDLIDKFNLFLQKPKRTKRSKRKVTTKRKSIK